MKIYNLGSLNLDYVYAVDHFVTAGETLSSDALAVLPGGKGLNQSVALARAGAAVIQGAVVGDQGDLLMETLAGAGVDISRIRHQAGSCGHAIIQVNRNGQNCILLFPGTNACVDEKYIEEFLADAEEGDILLLQNEISGLEIAFETACAKGMRIAFNPSPFRTELLQLPLSCVTWWFCNEIEGAMLLGTEDPEEMARIFVQRFPQSCLILTLGKSGSMLIREWCTIRQPAYRVAAVDTTAAGDTFTGYFLATLTAGMGEAKAMEMASKASALAVTKPGAAASIPVWDEVESL